MIEKLTGNLTPNRFIHIDSEEHTVLEQLGKMQPKINEVVTETNRIDEDVKKKVYTDDLHNKYKLKDNADFTGSWFGVKKPTFAEPGIAGVVDRIDTEIENAKTNIGGVTFPTLEERLNSQYNYLWDFGLNVWVRYYFHNGALNSQKLVSGVWVDI